MEGPAAVEQGGGLTAQDLHFLAVAVALRGTGAALAHRLPRLSGQGYAVLEHVGNAEQRVAGAQGVVEEGEGPILLERDQPERELGHLHGQGVLVHAVEAAVGHQAAGLGQALLGVA